MTDRSSTRSHQATNTKQNSMQAAEQRSEESGEDEAQTREGTEGVKGALTEKVFDGLKEKIEASDRRDVENDRHGREGYGEEELQHLIDRWDEYRL
ncbi:hypothetical protein F0562_017137 [Nyssa sinensis]|uniref:Uncharacterized protein n=1 Tax=Nyssa sinensis TaxID=561372 RepID=A0A5J4ZET7_9ASTE|nr:hypothetical protein F0562_017137 [Nyssa sinensis]